MNLKLKLFGVMTCGFETGIDSVRVMCGKMSNSEATLLVRTLVTSSLTRIQCKLIKTIMIIITDDYKEGQVFQHSVIVISNE